MDGFQQMEESLRIMELDRNILSTDALEDYFYLAFWILLSGEWFDDIHDFSSGDDLGIRRQLVSVFYRGNLAVKGLDKLLKDLVILEQLASVIFFDLLVLLLELLIDFLFTFLQLLLEILQIPPHSFTQCRYIIFLYQRSVSLSEDEAFSLSSKAPGV